ncbi:MAG: hypothetical protein ACD_45C00732G0009 [uncultured bacterium]|nr:MAG: hypothetical protein ACD_45C00732G0009 [uncultured bacterium]
MFSCFKPNDPEPKSPLGLDCFSGHVQAVSQALKVKTPAADPDGISYITWTLLGLKKHPSRQENYKKILVELLARGHLLGVINTNLLLPFKADFFAKKIPALQQAILAYCEPGSESSPRVTESLQEILKDCQAVFALSSKTSHQDLVRKMKLQSPATPEEQTLIELFETVINRFNELKQSLAPNSPRKTRQNT